MKKMLQLVVFVAASVLLSTMHGMERADKSLADLAGSRAVAYLEDAVQESLLKLHELYPQWGSELFKKLCKDLQLKANVLLHQQAVQVVDECIALCAQELQKNVVYKQVLEVIKADLQDYQQFLASEASRLDAHNVMITKRRCCAPAVNCFNIAPYIPFLPTMPVAPGNYFSLIRRTSGAPIVIDDLPFSANFPFTSVIMTDGSWTWSSGAPGDLVAQVSGVFLVTFSLPFFNAGVAGDEPPLSVYLRATIDTIPVPFTVFATDDLGVTDPTEYEGRQLTNNFIVSVQAGQVLNFQVARSPGSSFFISAAPIAEEALSVNGMVTIVRLR